MLNEDIKVFGLFGFPLSHSLSPAMHNQALRALGIPGIYFAFERNKSQFLCLLRSRRKLILDGFNLTVPLKECIAPYLDVLDRSAKEAGAVNAVERIRNRWIGYNTDVFGFRKMLLEAHFHARRKKAVILGAGGAARAVLVSLAKERIGETVLWNRTISRADRLIREFRRKFPRVQWKRIAKPAELKSELADADLLVNTTSVGLKASDPPLVPAGAFPKKRILVLDLVYGRRKTKLLQLAKRLGHSSASGESMLLYQAAKAFEIWTKRKAPLSVMRHALHDAILAH